MAGRLRGDFGNLHDFVTKYMKRILIALLTPILQQCSIKTNVRNADARIGFNAHKKSDKGFKLSIALVLQSAYANLTTVHFCGYASFLGADVCF